MCRMLFLALICIEHSEGDIKSLKSLRLSAIVYTI